MLSSNALIFRMDNPALAQAFYFLLKRDLLLAFRRRTEAVIPLLFFVLVITLFPLGVGNKPQLLQSMAPGVIWVAALLAAMLSLDSIFRSDFEDGSLEQLLLSTHPASLLVLAKVTAHWLVTGVPLIIIAPLLGVLLGLTGGAIGVLILTLSLGTPVLSLIGAIGVALTVGLRRGGMILSLLVLPLYVPVLIFASGAVEMAGAGLPFMAQLYMLTALLALALTLTPLPTAAALRISVS
jgi:heme exporter protein B